MTNRIITDQEALAFFEERTTLTMDEIYQMCADRKLDYDINVRPTFENLKIHRTLLNFEDKSPNKLASKFTLVNEGTAAILQALDKAEKRGKAEMLPLDKAIKWVTIISIILLSFVTGYKIYKATTIEQVIESIGR